MLFDPKTVKILHEERVQEIMRKPKHKYMLFDFPKLNWSNILAFVAKLWLRHKA